VNLVNKTDIKAARRCAGFNKLSKDIALSGNNLKLKRIKNLVIVLNYYHPQECVRDFYI
jgi:hypothetical protein